MSQSFAPRPAPLMSPRPGADRSGLELPEVPAWLDEVEGGQALAWVAERNTATRGAYEDNEGFQRRRGRLETILDAPDRIPGVSEALGLLYNVWTDAEHPRGLWRRTTWESYRAGAPGPEGVAAGATDWDLLLDVDALGEAEGRRWVWHGASLLRTGPLAGRRALVDLSDGGSDSDITREYDLDAHAFIDPTEGGFTREASKGSLSWADDNGERVLALADWGPGSLTASGYPRQVRRLIRGERAGGADPAGGPGELLLVAPADAVAAWARRDRWGRTWLSTSPDFYTEELWLLPDDAATLPVSAAAGAGDGLLVAPGAIHVDVPASASALAVRGHLLIEPREDWETGGRTYPAGSLLAAPLKAFLAGSRDLAVLFSPTRERALQGWSATEHHIVLSLLDDVVDTIEVATEPASPGGAWRVEPLDLAPLAAAVGPQVQAGPADGDADPTLLRPGRPLLAVGAGAVSALEGDRLWLTASSFTTPATLAVGDLDGAGALGRVEVLRRAPEHFDATGVIVSQHVAVSDDGTRVPYFQVGRPSPDGSPVRTMLYGYGGFEVPLGIGYLPSTGAAWLEEGGAYVVANLRGGGEYGPAWHRAAVKRNRHRVHEDFAAVARSLVERGVTTPSGLAVHGGSNGGLLVGTMLTRYPELVGAVVCEVPLLDMRRYTHLPAGASWEAEYGDPDDPDQWEWIKEFSPFHLLRRGVVYPPTLIITSTRDDRVHPAHARTMAHRMLTMGQDVTYFENSEGGHGRASTNAQRAWMSALVHTFAWERLHPHTPSPQPPQQNPHRTTHMDVVL